MLKKILIGIWLLTLSTVLLAQQNGLIRPPENPKDVKPKLRYFFYQGDWNHLPDFSIIEPNYMGEVSRPYLKIFGPRDHFAVKFSGYIKIQRDGVYTFYLLSDAGSSLFIGDKEVVNNDGLHAERERSGEILLRSGLHRININYFDKTGDELLKVYYSGPGFHKTFIPPSSFFHEEGRPPIGPVSTIPGLIASFYPGPFCSCNDDKWHKQKIVMSEPKAVDIVAMPTTKLNVLKAKQVGLLQFKGFIQVPRSGVYVFQFNSANDGAMWIDNKRIIDNDRSYSTRERVGYIPLTAGKHRVIINYFEKGRGKSKRLNLTYRGPIVPRQPIPPKQPIPNEWWSYEASFHSPDNDNSWEFQTLYEDSH